MAPQVEGKVHERVYPRHEARKLLRSGLLRVNEHMAEAITLKPAQAGGGLGHVRALSVRLGGALHGGGYRAWKAAARLLSRACAVSSSAREARSTPRLPCLSGS